MFPRFRLTPFMAALFCLRVLAMPQITSAADDRPNLIVIVADDMNWNDCGAYGHPNIHTPNIDRLASEGMRFDRAYLTTSSCSPSRSSILTGRYPHNTGAEQLHWPLPADAITFAKLLKQNGYYTASSGKWHLGNAVKDQFDTVQEASAAGFVLPTGKADADAPRMVAKQPSGCEGWVDTLKNCPADRPFFLWLAALDPHREYEPGSLSPPHKLSDVRVPPHLPDTPEVREDLRLYYDEIGRLDKYVGLVMDELDRRALTKNTFVLFISDNGRPFPRDKTTLYEGGIRTPFIVRWPAQVAAGTVSSSLVSTVDIAPTLLGLAGIAPLKAMPGHSFLPILKDPSATTREYAFAEKHWHDYEDHARAVIGPRFKLIRNDYPDLPSTPPADAGRSPTWQVMKERRAAGTLPPEQSQCFTAPRPRWELYDLSADPNEFHNLADDPAHAETLERLQTALVDWTKRTNDYLPSVRTPDEFDRKTGEPINSVRKRPRPSKQQMFGTTGQY